MPSSLPPQRRLSKYHTRRCSILNQSSVQASARSLFRDPHIRKALALSSNLQTTRVIKLLLNEKRGGRPEVWPPLFPENYAHRKPCNSLPRRRRRRNRRSGGIRLPP